MAATEDKIQQIICLDFETGGLTPSKNPITQVGALAFRSDTFQEIDRYEDFCKPYNNLEYQKAALDYTGITMNQINNGVTVQTIVKNLIELAKKANTGNHFTKKPILLGHNVSFDIKFLKYIFALCKEDVGRYFVSDKDHENNTILAFHDTMHIARYVWPTSSLIPNHKLGTCCSKAKVELIDAHNALADVIATAELFQYFVKNSRSEGSGEGEEVSEVRFRETFQIK